MGPETSAIGLLFSEGVVLLDLLGHQAWGIRVGGLMAVMTQRKIDYLLRHAETIFSIIQQCNGCNGFLSYPAVKVSTA